MLTAIRELILDGPVPVGGAAARRAALAARFPDLSDSELDDLAAIPPERLGVYTRLIFNGERSALRWGFPMSLAAVHRLLDVPQTSKEVNDADSRLVRDLHRRRPWQSASHRDLAANFCKYVVEDRPELLAKWPGLADLAVYERADVDVFYAADCAHEPCDPDSLQSLTVGELMTIRVVRPGYAETHVFDCDVLALAEHWRAENRLPESLPSPAPTHAAVGRDPRTLSPAWVRLTTADAAGLSSIRPGTHTAINDIADAFISAFEHAADERAAFDAFFSALRRWFTAGVLLRAES